MKVVPLGEHVVVKRIDANGTTQAGLVLPDGFGEQPQQGRVLSIGDGRLLADGTRARHQVNEGDRILFSNYAGSELLVPSSATPILFSLTSQLRASIRQPLAPSVSLRSSFATSKTFLPYL